MEKPEFKLQGTVTGRSIHGFSGEYRFLSNFYMVPVVYEGIEYRSAEHAFQAAKTNLTSQKMIIAGADYPSTAKELGKKVELRPDWEQVKVSIMKDIVRAKFTQNKYIQQKLLNTYDAYLEETNIWHDTFWGVCDGEGHNQLGKILMEIRSELKNESETT